MHTSPDFTLTEPLAQLLLYPYAAPHSWYNSWKQCFRSGMIYRLQ